MSSARYNHFHPCNLMFYPYQASAGDRYNFSIKSTDSLFYNSLLFPKSTFSYILSTVSLFHKTVSISHNFHIPTIFYISKEIVASKTNSQCFRFAYLRPVLNMTSISYPSADTRYKNCLKCLLQGISKPKIKP